PPAAFSPRFPPAGKLACKSRGEAVPCWFTTKMESYRNPVEVPTLDSWRPAQPFIAAPAPPARPERPAPAEGRRRHSRLTHREKASILMVSFNTPHRHSFNPSSSKGINMRGFVAVALSLTLTLVQAAPLMAAPAMRAARPGGGQPGATGTLTGTAQTSTGQTLPNFTVQVRNLKTGELVGTTTSNSAGSFSFTGLSPADYVVEVVNQAGASVGSSAA